MDVMYPMDAVTRAAMHSRKTYPHTPLRLYVEALGGVVKPVLDRACSIGIVGSLPIVPDELQSEPLLDLTFATVVSPSHPLAAKRGVISASAIAKQVQLVLTDRTALSEGRDYGVLSPLTWRLADLGAKHAFLRAGLGWGHMPWHMVKADLDSGALVKIRVEGTPRDFAMPMKIVFRKDAPPGPAGRAFIGQLTQGRRHRSSRGAARVSSTSDRLVR